MRTEVPLTTSHNFQVKSMHRNSSLQSGLLRTYRCLDSASSYLWHTPTTNNRSGTEADDDAPRQIDQSKLCILYSVKILSQHYRKPQINTNSLLHTAEDTGNDLEITGSHSGAAEDSSLGCYTASNHNYLPITTAHHISFTANTITIKPFNFTQHKYILTQCTQDTAH